MKPHKVKFVPYRSKKNGQHYWRLKGGNGEKIAGGCEAFKKKVSRKQFERFKQLVAAAEYAG